MSEVQAVCSICGWKFEVLGSNKSSDDAMRVLIAHTLEAHPGNENMPLLRARPDLWPGGRDVYSGP